MLHLPKTRRPTSQILRRLLTLTQPASRPGSVALMAAFNAPLASFSSDSLNDGPSSITNPSQIIWSNSVTSFLKRFSIYAAWSSSFLGRRSSLRSSTNIPRNPFVTHSESATWKILLSLCARSFISSMTRILTVAPRSRVPSPRHHRSIANSINPWPSTDAVFMPEPSAWAS